MSIEAEPSKEPTRPRPAPTAFVDQPTQCLKEVGPTMNLVQNHELIFMSGQGKFWLGKFGLVAGRFEIEIERWPGRCDVKGESRLTNLCGPSKATAG